jgi:ribonuclease HI
MPWVRATLKGQKVFARADASGRLTVQRGRVEIRYRPNDGRRYDARADNLEILDPTPLPDETCGAAEAVAAARPGAKARSPKGGGGGKSSASSRTSEDAAPASVPHGAVVAYADGACSGNPGPAGLGVVVIDGDERVELSEYLGDGLTNNIAELTAVLRVLDEVADSSRTVMIHTDSQYTIGVVQKGWKAKANKELVAELREALSDRHGVRLYYVPGHSGVPLNERADALAREAIKERKTRRAVLRPQRPAPPEPAGEVSPAVPDRGGPEERG